MHDLGDLADPSMYHAPLDISGADPHRLITQLETMMLIRLAERHLAASRKAGLIGGPVHLGVGQEAIAVGVAELLRPTDRVFGTHRSHAHLLAMKSSVHGLFAEVLGKSTGYSKGMGGSMHLWDATRGFYGSVPIVAGTIPLAVGAALAAKIQGSDAVSVAYFGDGAVEEGAFHESLNLARTLKVPVLFVAENNLFSSHMHIRLRQPGNCTARFARAHDIACEVIDGNDVVEVTRAAERLIGAARRGEGPGFLEAVTFRWYGHVDWRDDIDVGVERSMTDIENWRARDPIKRLQQALERDGHWTAAADEALMNRLTATVTHAWAQAMADPWPGGDVLLDYVYSR
jgi:pyruvate dehydrogenase E1 component alpha subunit